MSISFSQIKAPGSEQCTICAEEWQKGEEVAVHNGEHPHTYHTHCIRNWTLQRLQTAMVVEMTDPPACPLCNREITQINGETIETLRESLKPNEMRGQILVNAVVNHNLYLVRLYLAEGEVFPEHKIQAIQKIVNFNNDGKQILALLLGEDPREEYVEAAIVKVAGLGDIETLRGLLDGRDLDNSIYQVAVVEAAEKDNLRTLRFLLQYRRASDELLQAALEKAAVKNASPEIQAELIAGRQFTEQFLHGLEVIKAVVQKDEKKAIQLLAKGEISQHHREMALACLMEDKGGINLNIGRLLLTTGKVSGAFFEKAVEEIAKTDNFAALSELFNKGAISESDSHIIPSKYYQIALVALAKSTINKYVGYTDDSFSTRQYEEGLRAFIKDLKSKRFPHWEHQPVLENALRAAIEESHPLLFKVLYEEIGGLSKELTEGLFENTENPVIAKVLLESKKISKECFDKKVLSIRVIEGGALDLFHALSEFGTIPPRVRDHMIVSTVSRQDKEGMKKVLSWGDIDGETLRFCIVAHMREYPIASISDSEHFSFARELLKATKNKEAIYNEVLALAVSQKRVATVSELLASGHVSDNAHQTALYAAAGLGGNLEVLRVLLSNRRIPIEVRDRLLSHTLLVGTFDRVKEILEDGEVGEETIQKLISENENRTEERDRLLSNAKSLQQDGEVKRAARAGDYSQLSEALLTNREVSLSARMTAMGSAWNQRDFNMGALLIRDAAARCFIGPLNYFLGDALNPLENAE